MCRGEGGEKKTTSILMVNGGTLKKCKNGAGGVKTLYPMSRWRSIKEGKTAPQ